MAGFESFLELGTDEIVVSFRGDASVKRERGGTG